MGIETKNGFVFRVSALLNQYLKVTLFGLGKIIFGDEKASFLAEIGCFANEVRMADRMKSLSESGWPG